MNTFGAWLVDLDGTLYRQRPVRLAMAAELLLCAPHRIGTIRRFRREQERMRAADAPVAAGCPYRLQLESTAAGLGVGVEQLAAVIHDWMERRPGKWLRLFRRQKLIDEIAAFRATGGRTALVSDYPATTKLASLRVAALFDVVVASGERDGPTTLKPSPEGYLLAAERLGIPAKECLVIGDRDDADGVAAKRAGMSFRRIH